MEHVNVDVEKTRADDTRVMGQGYGTIEAKLNDTEVEPGYETRGCRCGERQRGLGWMWKMRQLYIYRKDRGSGTVHVVVGDELNIEDD